MVEILFRPAYQEELLIEEDTLRLFADIRKERDLSPDEAEERVQILRNIEQRRSNIRTRIIRKSEERQVHATSAFQN